MRHDWESCSAIILIEGRGPVRCWVPPRPGHTLCPAHDPGPDPVTGESELQAMVSALLKQLHPEAEMSDFVRLPGGPHYALQIGVPGGVAKWVIVPESTLRTAPVDPPTHRALRDCLALIFHESRRRLGDSAEQQARPSGRVLLPALHPMTLSGVPATAGIPKWILVADDDDTIREIWSEMLRVNGYYVLTARNGLEALQIMSAVIPDLIMLDLRMPEIDGPTFLNILEGAPTLRRMPVLIISGFLQDDSSRDSLGLNIVGRLSKPLRQAELLEAVRAALETAGHPA